ncbi:uncharacterized protein LOC118432927 [Folsomia candida]|uniref:uncharacterized protein LOC118432927 n=1 Tax=Folsomia candida TaxID=158441 RepID=UPI001604C7D7|nr:uncharacterized protein LOC118432927 [Folsomia candida]
MRTSTIVGTVVVVLTFLFGQSWGQQGTCGGDCLFSEDCALEAGDLTCRCSYFHCKTIPEGTCGGGCISDYQCSRWAGDDNCICGTLFECVRRSELETPGYKAFANFMLSIRGASYQTKVANKLKLYRKREDKDH